MPSCVAGRGCLGYDGGAVEDAAQDHFVMRDAAVHGLLTTIEKHFEMFCSEVNTVTVLGGRWSGSVHTAAVHGRSRDW